MTVKKQVSYSDNIIIREACGVNRMCVNVIADFVLIAVSGCGYKKHIGIPDCSLKFWGGLSGAEA